MRIGLFFGSFNPVHIGHMIIANMMSQDTDLDEVWMVVSPQSPFKISTDLADEKLRLLWVDLAIGDHIGIKSCRVEFDLPRPSYTIQTLDYLRDRYPYHDFVIIMGEDNLFSLQGWKEADRIIEEFDIYVYKRNMSQRPPDEVLRQVKMLDFPYLDISATEIRERLRAEKNIRYLVPERVFQFLRDENVYLLNADD